MRLPSIIALLFVLSSAALAADDPGRSDPATENFFYHGYDYGSEASLHPLPLILNGGFHVMQLSNRSNRPEDMDFKKGWDLVWLNLRNPIKSIEHEGWGSFVRKEILPFSTGIKDARFWPNYTLHLLGGGMTYRMMIEYYRYHGSGHPKLLSAGTMVAYHLLNEVAEVSYLDGYTTDPVADIYLFDPLACVLFSNDGIARFFGETMSLRDWSYQVNFDPWNASVENVGVRYAMKWKPPFWDRTSLFYTFGAHGAAGFSREVGDGYSWSLAAGFAADKLVTLEDGGLSVNLKGVASVFFDRHNSLLASLMLVSTRDYSLRMNVYPGLVKVGDWSPSFFVAQIRDSEWVFGAQIATPNWQPIGLARRF